MITPTNALLIKWPLTRPIRHTNISNLLPDFIPVRARRRDREEPRQEIVRGTRNKEATEEVQVVDICRAFGHGLANGSDEPNNVDKDAANVGRVAAPREAEGVEVWRVRLGRVEIFDLEVAFSDDVVIADDDARD